MKTQISKLRSGTKNQVLNPEINYSQLPHATSHGGHGGTNSLVVSEVWKKVVSENPGTMKIYVKGIFLDLNANWSLSRKSVSFYSPITKEDLKEKFFIEPSKKQNPYISVQGGNIILVSNGKNSFTHICPSFIDIL